MMEINLCKLLEKWSLIKTFSCIFYQIYEPTLQTVIKNLNLFCKLQPSSMFCARFYTRVYYGEALLSFLPRLAHRVFTFVNTIFPISHASLLLSSLLLNSESLVNISDKDIRSLEQTDESLLARILVCDANKSNLPHQI